MKNNYFNWITFPQKALNIFITNIKKDVHLASIAGGTDLVGCLVLGNLFSNVYKGEIQGQSLAIDIDIFDESGQSIEIGNKGELVIKKPFPSMPLKFGMIKIMKNFIRLTLINLKYLASRRFH